MPNYLKTKTCRLCLYYELNENFCAVAPNYIGQAHLCKDFKLWKELDEEEEEIDLKSFTYEQFSKNYLKKLLSPYGKIEVERTLIIPSTQDINLWFAPKVSSFPKELGLLARLTKTRALFEPCHNHVTSCDIRNCLRKLIEVQEEYDREAKIQNAKLKESQLPWLWIFTPTISETILEGCSAREKRNEEKGIYFMPPAFRVGLVVIDQLPQTSSTLWLRILGRGSVRHQALSELEALPINHFLRLVSSELLSDLLCNLETLSEKDEEDRQLIEQLTLKGF